MTISELSVRRPVLMTMVYVMLIVVSVLFLPRLDQAMFPDVDLPFLMVVANCGDADPESIEIQVAKTLEEYVSSVENLNKMTSYSRNGNCYVFLEFNYGTDIDKAESDVNSYLSLISRFLPSWVENVNVLQINSMMSSGSVLTLSVAGPYSLSELKSITERDIEPLISRIEGVGRVDVSGGGDTEFHVAINPNRLNAYNVPISSVTQALALTNIIGSGGEITENFVDYSVRIDNRFRSIKDIENTLVTTIGGSPVYIKDLGIVYERPQKGASESFLNDDPIVSISVYKNSDESITKVASNVKKQLKNINTQLPNGVQVVVRRDSSKIINATLNEVFNSALIGVVLAALIIFIFIRGFKATLIISLSMPICILFTLMMMAIFDISINMISMSGLILGIGMIVDASIIILENSIRYRQLGESAPGAAILGSKSMFAAIFASTITTICVFLPEIIYMNELKMVGQMLRDLIFTVCISLLSSLFVALTLVPALFSILRVSTSTQRQHGKLFTAFDNFGNKVQKSMERGYVRSLAFFIDHKSFFVIPLVLLFVFCISFVPRMKLSLFPRNTNDDNLRISLKMAEGTNQQVTKEKLENMKNKVIETFPNGSYTNIILNANNNEGSLSIALLDISKQKKGQSAAELRELIRPYFKEDPSCTWSYSSGQGFSNSSPIDVEISSDNLQDAFDTAQDVEALLKSIPELTNVSNSLTAGKPQLNIVVDQKRASALGISPSTISSVLSTSIDGSKATQISALSASETYYLRVLLADDYIKTKSQIGALLIPSSYGMVRLDSVASITESTSPTTIQRENKKRINHVTADTIDNVSTSEALAKVKELIDQNIVVKDTVKLGYGGDSQEFKELLPPIIICVLMAVLLVYVVMAAQFESLLNPFIVFCTIPLLFIGVILIYVITRQAISVMSFIGVVALIGVVVNNGIVLVDAITREINENRTPVRDACLMSAENRLRPILMTTLTTVLGMVPMAFSPAKGSQMMQPIALTFVGGIITGAFITLYLSPLLYHLFNKSKDKKFDDPNTLQNQLYDFDIRMKKSLLENL